MSIERLKLTIIYLLGTLLLCTCAPASEVPRPQEVSNSTVRDTAEALSAVPSATVARPATATAVRPSPKPTPTPTPTTLPTPTPVPEQLLIQSAALRPGLTDLETLVDLPVYNLRLWVEPARRALTGTLDLHLTNRSSEPLFDLVFRLYPNFPRDVLGRGGDVQMHVDAASVRGTSTAVDNIAQGTAVRLKLPRPLLSKEATAVQLIFSATITSQSDGSWALPSYYPILAVRDDSGWRVDITTFADHVFAEAAFYKVELVAPSAFTVVTTGSTIRTLERPDGRTVYPDTLTLLTTTFGQTGEKANR